MSIKRKIEINTTNIDLNIKFKAGIFCCDKNFINKKDTIIIKTVNGKRRVLKGK